MAPTCLHQSSYQPAHRREIHGQHVTFVVALFAEHFVQHRPQPRPLGAGGVHATGHFHVVSTNFLVPHEAGVAVDIETRIPFGHEIAKIISKFMLQIALLLDVSVVIHIHPRQSRRSLVTHKRLPPFGRALAHRFRRRRRWHLRALRRTRSVRFVVGVSSIGVRIHTRHFRRFDIVGVDPIVIRRRRLVATPILREVRIDAT